VVFWKSAFLKKKQQEENESVEWLLFLQFTVNWKWRQLTVHHV